MKKKLKKRHLEFVLLTDEEYSKLCDLLGPDGAADWIEDLNDYLGSIKNKNKYDSHYHTIRQWAKRAGKKQGAVSGTQCPGDDYARAADRFVLDLKEHSAWPDMSPRTRSIVYAVLLARKQQWTTARKALIDDPTIATQLREEFLAEAKKLTSL